MLTVVADKWVSQLRGVEEQLRESALIPQGARIDRGIEGHPSWHQESVLGVGVVQ